MMNWSWLKAFVCKKECIDESKKNDKVKFPCVECLVGMTCTQACNKIEMDNHKLKELFLEYNACPDCGCPTFREGPTGGGSVNVKCNRCGHWFNFGLPLFIERIHINKDTGKFYE